jgi:hypothetical protein
MAREAGSKSNNFSNDEMSQELKLVAIRYAIKSKLQ